MSFLSKWSMFICLQDCLAFLHYSLKILYNNKAKAVSIPFFLIYYISFVSLPTCDIDTDCELAPWWICRHTGLEDCVYMFAYMYAFVHVRLKRWYYVTDRLVLFLVMVGWLFQHHWPDCVLSRHKGRLLNWALPSDTFPRFAELLSVSTYTHFVLLGMTVSVGGLTESLVSTSNCLLQSITMPWWCVVMILKVLIIKIMHSVLLESW